MRSQRVAGLIVFGALVSLAIVLSMHSHGSTTLDLQQGNRIRAQMNRAVVMALPSGYHFVKNGTLVIGTNPFNLPISAYAADAKTIVGFDVDLAQLIADSLGRKLEIVPIAWTDWPLALDSGRFDAVISNVTVTEDRKSKFDFSTYRQDVLGFYVKNDSKITAITGPKDVAGLRIIADRGTNMEKILLAWNKENVTHGLEPLTVLSYNNDEVTKSLAIQSGGADAVFDVNSVQAYRTSRQGKTRLVGTVSGGWPRTADVAIVTRRGSGLADALSLAINDLIASGAYTLVLKKWNLGSEGISKALTNPPGLPGQ